MNKTSRSVTFTILSMSLLTVMAGAAVAPALGVIRQHFASCNDLTVQFIVSLPALFIILTNLAFPIICRHASSRAIAVVGLLLYVTAGAGIFLVDHIALVLALRALLGVSVGLIMPLSTGLLAYYFPPQEQARLMGLSAAMNQMGGVVATMLAGVLATIGWNYAFLVYLLGLIALVMVIIYLPAEHLSANGGHLKLKNLVRFHPSVVGMFLLMTIFFIFPTRFALTARATTSLTDMQITLIMVGLDVVAFFIGLAFGRLMKSLKGATKYVAPLFFLGGYSCYACGGGVAWLLVGSALIGIANGIGVPYLNTIAAIKGGSEAATTVMPLLSASLYLGQFLSPLIVTPVANALWGDCPTATWRVGMLLSALMLAQVFLTRKHQSQPPTA